VEVEHDTHVSGSQVAYVQNIVATIRAAEPGPGVLLSAHYDSVANSPGAADDGAGVASLLEIARAITSGAAPRRSVVLLFTDGEEAGLCGATAFAARHSIKDVAALTVNIDARGSSGPGVMFETGPKSAALLGAYAASAPKPVATSLMPALYKLLANDTDFSVFKRAGQPGFNFALVDNLLSYHTGADVVSNLQLGSLQHLGASALAIARRFSEQPPDKLTDEERIYFNLGPWFTTYSAGWAMPLGALALALSVAAIVFGLRKRRMTARGLVLGVLAFPVVGAITAILSTLVWGALLLIHPQYRLLPYGETYNSPVYRVAMSAFALAVIVTIYNRLQRKTGWESLWAAALLWSGALALGLAAVAPGASYVFAWPALAGSIGLLVLTGMGWQFNSWNGLILLGASSVIAILLMLPVVRLLYMLFALGFLAPAVLILTFLCILLLPQWEAVRCWKPGAAPFAAAAACIVLLGAGALTSKTSKSAPLPSGLLYAASSETRKAMWLSPSRRLDEWNRGVLGTNPARQACATVLPGLPGECFVAPGDYASLLPPRMELLNDSKVGEFRTVRFRVWSQRRAAAMELAFERDAELVSVEVANQSLDIGSAQGEGGPVLRFLAPPTEGIELVCRLKKTTPLRIRLRDRSYGLEQLPGFLPRPLELIPGGTDSDSVFVSADLTL